MQPTARPVTSHLEVFMLFTEVQPVHAAAVRAANLLASALDPVDTGVRWREGMAWRSESCPAYQPVDPCVDPADYPPASTDDIVYYKPSGFRVYDTCSSRNVGRDIQRVVRLADAATSYAMANELWTGVGTKANPYDTPTGDTGITNAYLAGTSATVITDTAADPMEALGILEEHARRQAAGQIVFLHVPPRIVTQLGAQLRRIGNLIYTQTDAVVVADPGYPGTGPDGSAGTPPGVWCYATGPVIKRVDEIVAINEASVTLDRRTNQRTIWAERMFAATFDPCCHFALQIS